MRDIQLRNLIVLVEVWLTLAAVGCRDGALTSEPSVTTVTTLSSGTTTSITMHPRRTFLELSPLTTEETESPIPYRDMPSHHPEESPEFIEATAPLNYRWHQEYGETEGRVRIVCHAVCDPDNYNEAVCVRYYVGDQNRWLPAHEFHNNRVGGFEFHDVIHVYGRPMFFLCHNCGGSDSSMSYDLVSLVPSPQKKLAVVSIDYPAAAVKAEFEPTQSTSTTWITYTGADRFGFDFAFWRSDYSNRPERDATAIGISGTMKLVLNDDREPTRLVVEHWKRSESE